MKLNSSKLMLSCVVACMLTTSSFAGDVLSGVSNTASGNYAVVAGGYLNNANGDHSVVSAGERNDANNGYSTVSGGAGNKASAVYSVVSGGNSNNVFVQTSVISGGAYNNIIDDNVFGAGNSFIGAGMFNTISGAGGLYSVIGAGKYNKVTGQYSFVGAGSLNEASGSASVIAGGSRNISSNNSTTVSGGSSNTASGIASTVGGGGSNVASGRNSTISGGYYNMAQGYGSTVIGGMENQAVGAYSVAAGNKAQALASGSFAFSDASSPSSSFDVNTANSFGAKFSGGYNLYTSSDLSSGVYLSSGAGAWNTISDVTKKENFEEIDKQEILEKLVNMPIKKWNYISQDSNIKHIGPFAQDFYAAYGLGDGDTTISTIDPDGVALVSIQALYGMIEEKDKKIDDLTKRLEALEKLMSK